MIDIIYNNLKYNKPEMYIKFDKLLKEIYENYIFELKWKYADNEEYISKMKKIYNDLQYQIQDLIKFKEKSYERNKR